MIAIWAITAAFESWIYRVGQIGIVSRLAFAAGGVLILFPEMLTSLLGAAVLAAVIIINLVLRRPTGGPAQA